MAEGPTFRGSRLVDCEQIKKALHAPKVMHTITDSGTKWVWLAVLMQKLSNCMWSAFGRIGRRFRGRGAVAPGLRLPARAQMG